MDTYLERWLPWKLMAIVVIASVVAWAEMRQWNFDNMSALALFPLLGLLAWSIMWTHYAIGGIRLVRPFERSRVYSQVSATIVLFCLLLHPGLLAYNQYRVTDALPPTSFYNYVGQSLQWAILLGTISLIIFLSFEFFKRLKTRGWVARNWRWISISQMIAMTLIFIHALALGQNLQSGWFLFWWVGLGVLLIPCFGLILRADWASAK